LPLFSGFPGTNNNLLNMKRFVSPLNSFKIFCLGLFPVWWPSYFASDTFLEVGWGSSTDSHVGKHQCLESNASDYQEPVEVAEEVGYMGEFW